MDNITNVISDCYTEMIKKCGNIIQEKNKQYKLDNRDKILEHKKQKVNCDICNSIVNRTNLARHKKTDKCIKFQELIESK